MHILVLLTAVPPCGQERQLERLERLSPGEEASGGGCPDHSLHLGALLMSLQSHLLAFCYAASANVDSQEVSSAAAGERRQRGRAWVRLIGCGGAGTVNLLVVC